MTLLLACLMCLCLVSIEPHSSTVHHVNGLTPSLILIDPFSEYLSMEIKNECKLRGINCIELVSGYLSAVFEREGRAVPDSFRIPWTKTGLDAWCDEQRRAGTR